MACCTFCFSTDHQILYCSALQQTECRYCHEFGHTKKHCPKLSHKTEFDEKRQPFWYFYVEPQHNQPSSSYNTPYAVQLRANLYNKQHFKRHLYYKYGSNWLFTTQNTHDDCPYLQRLRYNTLQMFPHSYYTTPNYQNK